MGVLRLTVRVPLVFFWTLALYSLRLLQWPLALYSEALDRRVRRVLFQTWARGLQPIIGMRVAVRGEPPQPPFFMVCNHLSYIDIFVIVASTGSNFVSRGDVAHWPVVGFICRSLYVLFIDRAKKRDAVRVNTLISETLEKGDGITVFPEAMVTRGRDVEPFKSALIEPAVANALPVYYAAITYETPEDCAPASYIVGWWRPEPFFHHVAKLLRNRRFTATITFGGQPLKGSERKELANELREAVRQHFTPVD